MLTLDYDGVLVLWERDFVEGQFASLRSPADKAAIPPKPFWAQVVGDEIWAYYVESKGSSSRSELVVFGVDPHTCHVSVLGGKEWRLNKDRKDTLGVVVSATVVPCQPSTVFLAHL